MGGISLADYNFAKKKPHKPRDGEQAMSKDSSAADSLDLEKVPEEGIDLDGDAASSSNADDPEVQVIDIGDKNVEGGHNQQ